MQTRRPFYIHCNPELFDIFIADTGSTDDEKETLKSNIKDYNNITLIEYDYYNFAKINNDVVKNHVTNDYEFLLFCNNDIKLLNNVMKAYIEKNARLLNNSVHIKIYNYNSLYIYIK